MLRRLFFIAVLAVAAGNGGYAQTEGEKKVGNSYLFGAPGVETCCRRGRGIVQVGGGAEATIYRGLGANADAGYMFPMDSAGAGVLTLSAGPIYQFSRNKQTVPFVTGGLSLAVREGAGAALHFGGGAIRWFSPKWGLRFEIRDHIPPSYSKTHFVIFRIGLAHR